MLNASLCVLAFFVVKFGFGLRIAISGSAIVSSMHLVHWSKFGILVPVIGIAGIFAGAAMLQPLHLSGRWESVTMFVPGVLLVVFGCWLDSRHQANSFGFIPMKFWGALGIIFGIVILITR